MLIADPRVDRTRLHNLGDILVIAVCCMLCGGEKTEKRGVTGKQKNASWSHDYLMKLLRSDAGPAGHPQKLDASALHPAHYAIDSAGDVHQ